LLLKELGLLQLELLLELVRLILMFLYRHLPIKSQNCGKKF
jgi:hypothetical protein